MATATPDSTALDHRPTPSTPPPPFPPGTRIREAGFLVLVNGNLLVYRPPRRARQHSFGLSPPLISEIYDKPSKNRISKSLTKAVGTKRTRGGACHMEFYTSCLLARKYGLEGVLYMGRGYKPRDGLLVGTGFVRF